MIFRRRNYFIKKDYQLDFSVKFVVLLCLEAVLIAGLFMSVSRNTLTTGYSDSVLKIENTFSYFFVPMALILLIAIIGISIAGMIVFIMLSHRIAGPLYRFKKVLEEIGAGDLTKRISLRKTDQLDDFKGALNELVGTFDQSYSRVHGIVSELDGLLKENQGAVDPKKIDELTRRLKEELSRFKVTLR